MSKPRALVAKLIGDRVIKLGHDGGDGTIICHCPFCGSGAVVGRSDATTECQSCMTMFTVQVQPQYPMSPQTMNGQDVTPPGMPGNLNDQQEQMGDMQQADEGMGDEVPPGMDPEQPAEDEEGDGGDPEGFPDDDEEEPGDDVAAEGDKDESPFPPKKSFRTSAGKELTEDQYVRHLMIHHAADKGRVLEDLRGRNSA